MMNFIAVFICDMLVIIIVNFIYYSDLVHKTTFSTMRMLTTRNYFNL